VILVYERDPAARAAIGRAVADLGHEARFLDTFVGVTELARALQPDVVVFSSDRNSAVTGTELGAAMLKEGIPVVTVASRSEIYSGFAMSFWFGATDRLWALERPFSAEGARAVLSRALGAGRAPRDEAWFARRRRMALPVLFAAVALPLALVVATFRDMTSRESDGVAEALFVVVAFAWLVYVAVPLLVATRRGVPTLKRTWVQVLFVVLVLGTLLAGRLAR
jgi:hypothetical protein